MARGRKHTPELVVILLRQIEAAVANGKATSAVVTACVRKSGWFVTQYRFSDVVGRILEGHGECKMPHSSGDWIWIIYLPDRPLRNHPYPLRYYRPVERV